MSLYSDLNEVLTPYAQRIKALDTKSSNIKADLEELQDGGYVVDRQKIQEKINDWLETHPEATTTVPDESITFAKLNPKLANTTYTLAQFSGDTNQQKFFNALNEMTGGILLCGTIEITQQYTAIAKDYRKITIVGATISLSKNEWFDQTNAIYKSVPQFDSCYIDGNDNVMYNSDVNCVGAMFRNCTLKNVVVFDSNTSYIQSLYLIGCDLNPIHTLFNAATAYDLKIIGCRIEATTGVLITVTSNLGIMQGTISDAMIEGRSDVVMSISACYDLNICGCYFEYLLGGLVEQTQSSYNCFMYVERCAFFKPSDNVSYAQYAINIASNNYRNCVFKNNLSNYGAEHYLCNKRISMVNYAKPNNRNYTREWYAGSPLSHDRYEELYGAYKTPTWNPTDETWDITFITPYEQAYTVLHPIYVVFAGSFGASVSYQGYAILRIAPRTAYNSNTGKVEIVCDVTIIDACNKATMTKSSDVTASVVASATLATDTDVTITIKIHGFTSSRGRYRCIDPWSVYGLELIKS